MFIIWIIVLFTPLQKKVKSFFLDTHYFTPWKECLILRDERSIIFEIFLKRCKFGNKKLHLKIRFSLTENFFYLIN